MIARPKMPQRLSNEHYRDREWLREKEVDALRKAARGIGRHGFRDATLILLAYQHGLRVSELVSVRWGQLDLRRGTFEVQRKKKGLSGSHPLYASELRALRRVGREYPATPYAFVSERGAPLTDTAVRKIVRRAGNLAKLPFPVHPHMLRHACGFKLANEGHSTRFIAAYLGHTSTQHAFLYTQIAEEQFRGLWD